MQPNINAFVVASGFNQTKDLLLYQGRQMASIGADEILPYFRIYERIKIGKKYAKISAVSGMQKSTANIMIIHSKDDKTVPYKYGYQTFYNTFAKSPSNHNRFTFISYDEKGHDHIFSIKNDNNTYTLDNELLNKIVKLFEKSV